MRRITLVIIVMVCWSCAEAPAIRLYVDVSSEIAIPDDIDEIQVSIAANSAGARVCTEETREFDLTSAQLPLYIRVEQGREFNRSVAYWIAGLQEGEQTLEERVGWITWPNEGVRDVDVFLEAGCLTKNLQSACSEEEHCIDERCLELNMPTVFITSSALQDVSCLAESDEGE